LEIFGVSWWTMAAFAFPEMVRETPLGKRWGEEYHGPIPLVEDHHAMRRRPSCTAGRILLALSALLTWFAPGLPIEAGEARPPLPVIETELKRVQGVEEMSGLLEGCGIECVLKWQTRVSSVSGERSLDAFAARLAEDRDVRTAWMPASSPTNGIGEWIEFIFHRPSEKPDLARGSGIYDTTGQSQDPLAYDFDRPPGTHFTSFLFLNGYGRNRASWQQYSRIKDLRLIHNGQDKCLIRLQDTLVPQVALVWKLSPKAPFSFVIRPGDRLRLEILSVYPGDSYPEVALSEVKLHGAH